MSPVSVATGDARRDSQANASPESHLTGPTPRICKARRWHRTKAGSSSTVGVYVVSPTVSPPHTVVSLEGHSSGCRIGRAATASYISRQNDRCRVVDLL